MSIRSLFKNAVPLYLPPLIDMTTHNGKDTAYLTVEYTAIRLATDAELTGIHHHGVVITDPVEINEYMTENLMAVKEDPTIPVIIPLTKTSFYTMTDKKKRYQVGSTLYGYPFFRFKKGLPVHVQVTNQTGFSYDLHWHGLNTTGDMDGAQQVVEFGNQTEIGPVMQINLPPITNNSCMQWVHAHPMFYTSMLATMGTFGLVDIIDEISATVNQDVFTYEDNYLMLYYKDIELNTNGTVDYRNTYIDGWRANYGMVNAHTAVCWSEQTSFYQPLTHRTTQSIVKIALVNTSGSFRTLYLGVCNSHGVVQPFYVIQSDTGLRNPCQVTITSITPGGRTAIVIDLDDFSRREAYVFFYNMDLTLTKNIQYDTSGHLVCTSLLPEHTVSPTPIPDETKGNGNSAIRFPPTVSNEDNVIISIPGSVLPQPNLQTISKKFLLQIKTNKKDKDKKGSQSSCISLSTLIRRIRNIIFGDQYCYIASFPKSQLQSFQFEYNAPCNYISLLNPTYFFNIPDIDHSPIRSFAFFTATPENYMNPYETENSQYYGCTDFISGANRIMVDCWNGSELNQTEAMYFYNLSPNQYKPNVLPSCLFKIEPTNTCFLNTYMVSNDTLYIDIFDLQTNPLPSRQYDASGNWIPDYTNYPYYADPTNPNTQYTDRIVNTTAFNGPNSPWPAPIVAKATIVFPKTDRPLTIQQWVELVNLMYSQTMVLLDGVSTPLSSFITFDWTYYPYQIPFATDSNETMYRVPIYINTVMMIHTNTSSRYYFRMTGKWELLQYFGKSIGAMRMNPPGIMPTMTKTGSMMMNYPDAAVPCMCMCNGPCTCGSNCECDDTAININTLIQEVYTVYADPLQPYQEERQIYPLMVNMTDITTFGIPPRDWNDTVLDIAYATSKGDNNGRYKGFVDGYANDTFMNFSVPLHSSEKWIYYNMDNQDSHPFHFHLTTGYCAPNDSDNTPELFEQEHTLYSYSMDTFAIGSQAQLSWYVTFPNYKSNYGGKYKQLGFMYHCHYLAHHDMMMMGQYYVH